MVSSFAFSKLSSVIGIMRYVAFPDWLLWQQCAFIKPPHIFLWIDSSSFLLLNDSPLYEHTMVCLSVCPLSVFGGFKWNCYIRLLVKKAMTGSVTCQSVWIKIILASIRKKNNLQNVSSLKQQESVSFHVKSKASASADWSSDFQELYTSPDSFHRGSLPSSSHGLPCLQCVLTSCDRCNKLLVDLVA